MLVVAPSAHLFDGSERWPHIDVTALLWLSPIAVFAGLFALLRCSERIRRNRVGFEKCPGCGQALPLRAGARFCPSCGAALSTCGERGPPSTT